jgi:hypothetical protein
VASEDAELIALALKLGQHRDSSFCVGGKIENQDIHSFLRHKNEIPHLHIIAESTGDGIPMFPSPRGNLGQPRCLDFDGYGRPMGRYRFNGASQDLHLHALDIDLDEPDGAADVDVIQRDAADIATTIIHERCGTQIAIWVPSHPHYRGRRPNRECRVRGIDFPRAVCGDRFEQNTASGHVWFKRIDPRRPGMGGIKHSVITDVGADVEHRGSHRYQSPVHDQLVQFVERSSRMKPLDVIVRVGNAEYRGNALEEDLRIYHRTPPFPRGRLSIHASSSRRTTSAIGTPRRPASSRSATICRGKYIHRDHRFLSPVVCIVRHHLASLQCVGLRYASATSQVQRDPVLIDTSAKVWRAS